MSHLTLARDLRRTLEKQGFARSTCHRDSETPRVAFQLAEVERLGTALDEIKRVFHRK